MTLTRSPVPPIYAFLSDCHRGALTAPVGGHRRWHDVAIRHRPVHRYRRPDRPRAAWTARGSAGVRRAVMGSGLAAAAIGDADRRIHRTSRYGGDWPKQADISDQSLGPALQRSALAIKGMTCIPTGSPGRRSPRRPQRVTTEGLQ